MKIKSGRPEIGPEGPKRLMNGVLVIFLAKICIYFFSEVQSRYGIYNSTVLMMKKNRAGPKSGLEGQKRSKNGVFVILFDNGSNDLLDFLCLVQSM